MHTCMQAIDVSIKRMVSEAREIVTEAGSSNTELPSCVEGFEFLVDHSDGRRYDD
jgi:hypothetical protein